MIGAGKNAAPNSRHRSPETIGSSIFFISIDYTLQSSVHVFESTMEEATIVGVLMGFITREQN